MNLEISYIKPATHAEASSVLSGNLFARIIAGGSDLIVKWKNGLFPDLTHLVDLSYLGLNKIEKTANSIKIGALCKMRELTENPLLITHFPALVSAANQVGAPQIRETATIGGNVANASPAGDTIPPLIGLDAKVHISGPDSASREVDLKDFITAPGKTVLKPGEFITCFELPLRKTQGYFTKLGERRAHAISKISAAVSSWLNADGTTSFSIALGSVGPKVIRASEAEKVISGTKQPPSEELIETASQKACEAVTPIDDIRSTAKYRREMAKVLVSRSLRQIIK
ncbi:MAG: xanthine dehydrogenase family protein subunit M [Candidatus Riflebacteria bacterium]|nr:xanthine dehydrogenase family protein subunit M [Candidatus Riflebacteria bacterium]